jgi:Kdo2-lipid IVA lauroyltransferase/acyltransferase
MGYRPLLILEAILMALPKSARKSFFNFLAFIAYRVSSRYRKVARDNLNFAFDGKMSQKEITSITKYSFKNLLYNFLQLMELRHMSKDELKSKISVVNEEAVEKVHAQGRSVIYVTTHYSSWELGGASIGAFVEPLAAVYKKMKNSVYEEWLLEARARFGNTNLEKSNVVKPLIRLIKNGGASGLLIDTNINPNEGTMVEFMGKSIRQTTTPAYLARKFDAAIIPVTIRTDDEENYTLIFYDEIPVAKTDNEKEDVQNATQLQADWLTALIRKEPKFWFWLHRRWKNDHPEIYE